MISFLTVGMGEKGVIGFFSVFTLIIRFMLLPEKPVLGADLSRVPVALVEDDDHLRGTVPKWINRMRRFQVVGCYASGEEALKGIPPGRAELVLMDVKMGGISGLDCACELLQSRQVNVLFVSAYADFEMVEFALRLGGSSVLAKPFRFEQLEEAMTVVTDGAIYLCSTLRKQVFETPECATSVSTCPQPVLFLRLTPREQEAMILLSRGLGAKGTADKMSISTHTLSNMMDAVHKKLGVESTVEAIYLTKAWARPTRPV